MLWQRRDPRAEWASATKMVRLNLGWVEHHNSTNLFSLSCQKSEIEKRCWKKSSWVHFNYTKKRFCQTITSAISSKHQKKTLENSQNSLRIIIINPSFMTLGPQQSGGAKQHCWLGTSVLLLFVMHMYGCFKAVGWFVEGVSWILAEVRVFK